MYIQSKHSLVRVPRLPTRVKQRVVDVLFTKVDKAMNEQNKLQMGKGKQLLQTINDFENLRRRLFKWLSVLLFMLSVGVDVSLFKHWICFCTR